MTVGFEEAEAYLDALGIDAMKKLAPSTHRIEALCDLLNHPERDVPAIHITGTNGKTSTARIATSLLAATGLRVGTYTSPHLQTVRERISLDGEPIDEAEFGSVFEHIRPYIETVQKQLGETLSYFEVMTGMFFLWAAESVDAIVVEVGLGGRWDATNVLPASVAVVTNVSLDHTSLLGSDRVTIATEKAGIVKDASVVVTAERSPDVLEVLNDRVATTSSELSALGKDFDLDENRIALGGRYLSMRSSAAPYEGLFLPLHGAHQAVNATTAVEAVTRFLPAHPPGHEVVLEGLAAVTAPGRLEAVPMEGSHVPVILDVAHNPAGMSAMVSALLEAFAFERVVFVIGVMRDKDHVGILAEIARSTSTVVATEARSARSVPAVELAASAAAIGLDNEVVENVPAALRRATEVAGVGDLICVTGSHYVVGEAREVLLPSKVPATRVRKR